VSKLCVKNGKQHKALFTGFFVQVQKTIVGPLKWVDGPDAAQAVGRSLSTHALVHLQ